MRALRTAGLVLAAVPVALDAALGWGVLAPGLLYRHASALVVVPALLTPLPGAVGLFLFARLHYGPAAFFFLVAMAAPWIFFEPQLIAYLLLVIASLVLRSRAPAVRLPEW